MRKPLCFLLILFLLLCCSPAVTLGWNVADQYEKAMELLKENKYDEAGQAFIALGSYNDSPRYAMYCNAIVAGKKGVYSVAVENLNSLNDFLDSSLLAIYYAGLSWEASEDYEQASEVMSSITLYRDVAERIAGYPALINARDYRKADRDEKAGKLELALSGFLALGRYSDSAERAASVQEKIHARDYYIADEAELNGDFAKAYSGFAALGDYKDSAQRAAVVKNKGNYAQAMQYAMEGDFSRAYSLFTDLADYEDSADKAYVLGVSQFAPLSDRKKGIAVFEFHDKWGLINVNTNSTTSPFWDEIGDFNKFGLAPVVKNKKYGYINTDGDIVIPCKWHMVSEFNEDGICTVSRESERNYYYGLYDNTGKEITSPEWRTLGGSYTLALGYGSDRDWITIPEFNEGKIKVQNDAGLYGFIDLEGKLVGKVCWNEIKAFSEGLAVVVEDGKYGFIDKNGDVVIRPQYTDALSFSENLAGVKNGSLWGFINRDNEFVIEPVYNEVKPFSGGWADVFHSESGWQIIDNAGKLIYFADRKLIEDYKSAMDRFDAADYEEAIGIFVTLKGYRDSFEKIEECRQKINQKDYQAAFALQQAGKYEEAIEAFRKLEEFSDAKRQIELCQACINDREYQKAVALK
ncbi:MAG: WG repeat-containing protein, partial [Clostridia bacterium]|nr:WG repeat-containing protein [Clostridia bacterium]